MPRSARQRCMARISAALKLLTPTARTLPILTMLVSTSAKSSTAFAVTGPRDAQRAIIRAGLARGQDRWPGLTQHRRPCMCNGLDPLYTACARDVLPNLTVDAPARRGSIFVALQVVPLHNHQLAAPLA